jgi:hypothetical protein
MNNPSDDNRMAAGSIPARGPNVATVPDQVYKKYIYIYISSPGLSIYSNCFKVPI